MLLFWVFRFPFFLLILYFQSHKVKMHFYLLVGINKVEGQIQGITSLNFHTYSVTFQLIESSLCSDLQTKTVMFCIMVTSFKWIDETWNLIQLKRKITFMSLFIPYHKRALCKNHFPLKERRGRKEGYWCKSHFIFDLSVQSFCIICQRM